MAVSKQNLYLGAPHQPVATQQAIDKFLEYCETLVVQKKGLIIRAGDPADTLYYIKEGSAAVITEDENGNDIILAYLSAGDFIGEIGLFRKTQHRHAQVRARTACTLARIEYDRLQLLFEKELKKEHPFILSAVGVQLSERLLKANRHVTRLAFMDVAGRIARTLLDLCNEPDALSHPQGTQLHISRQDLGRIVGCSRETVGRVLKQMQIEGAVEVNGMDIVVVHDR
jgi:CRP/FNR family cyclic AMP-dependent transcriptional regulator